MQLQSQSLEYQNKANTYRNSTPHSPPMPLRDNSFYNVVYLEYLQPTHALKLWYSNNTCVFFSRSIIIADNLRIYTEK